MKKVNWKLVVAILALLAVIGKIVGPPKKQATAKAAPSKLQQFAAHFSSWDGECATATKAIKAAMNNPKSYEHVKTNYKIIAPDSLFADVLVQCRGTNAFNAIITTNWHVKIDYNGLAHTATQIR